MTTEEADALANSSMAQDISADGIATNTGTEESEEQLKTRKRKERLEQNRISARESRKRKKTMIEELQRTVITLSRENKDLNERNEQLRRNLMEIGSKYPNVVPIHAIMGGAMAPPPAPQQQPQAAPVPVAQPQQAGDPNNPFGNPAMWARPGMAAPAMSSIPVPAPAMPAMHVAPIPAPGNQQQAVAVPQPHGAQPAPAAPVMVAPPAPQLAQQVPRPQAVPQQSQPGQEIQRQQPMMATTAPVAPQQAAPMPAAPAPPAQHAPQQQ